MFRIIRYLRKSKRFDLIHWGEDVVAFWDNGVQWARVYIVMVRPDVYNVSVGEGWYTDHNDNGVEYEDQLMGLRDVFVLLNSF